jgi:ribosomal protein S6--L-glutamate ligase
MFIGYDAVKEFGHVVIKQLRSNMGFGVFRIDDPDVAFQVFSYFINLNKPLYVQKYLNKRRGGDYRVIVVGGEAIGAEFRKGLNWKSNVAQGAKPMATKMPAEMREMAVKSAEILGLDYVGVDIAETKDGYYVLETNPTISWQGFKKATGINPAEKIVEHLIRKIKS